MNSVEERPSATTVSTIAIRAGQQSTIVVALLKSFGYVSLRIDEMQPRMLEFGTNASETSMLLNIHTDLMKRLRSKDDQVKELLARANALVTEQKQPDALVYEAMAQSLEEAWKGLNRQLAMRGYLLAETLKFYQLAQRHERLSAELDSLLRSATGDVAADNLADILKQINTSVDELINVTASAVGSGADIISQIRILGAMNDNEEHGQEIVDACLQIEKVMLGMAIAWETMDESWKNERSKLKATADRSTALLSQIQDIERWLRNAQSQLKAGINPATLMEQAKQNRILIDSIISSIARDSAVTSLSGRAAQLQTDIENFIRDLEQRSKEFDEVQMFIKNANAMLTQLSAMETDILNANGAMAGELAPLARQKASPLIEEGRRLSHVDASVSRLVGDIELKLDQIERLARERIEATHQKLREELTSLESWLYNVAEPFVRMHNQMGSKVNEIIEFCEAHKQLSTDIINRKPIVNSLANRIGEMTDSDRSRFREFNTRYEMLTNTVDSRIQLGNSFQQVHKFARELEASFESLDALLSANRNFSNEKLVTQMTEVFRMIRETLSQERNQGEKFIESITNAAQSDQSLNINQSIDSVRKILTDHEFRLQNVTENWSNWQQRRVEEKRVIRTVEEIQMWQEETIDVIKTMEQGVSKKTTNKELEEFKKKMDVVLKQLPVQREKILDAEKQAKLSEGEEAFDKIVETKKRQGDIEQQLTKISETITIKEESNLREERQAMEAPRFITTLHDAEVDEGCRFEFSAKIEGKPQPNIEWLKDGINVVDNVDYHTSYMNSVASLVIDETFVEDTAIYTVRAKNPAGETESSAKLTVKSKSEMGSVSESEAKPRFIRQLHNVTVTEGDRTFLDCVIVGTPEPKVTWYREEVAIRESERIELSFTGDHCSLTIKNTLPSDAGMYKVTASNNFGETTNFCRVSVQPKPLPPPTPPKTVRVPLAPSFNPSLSDQVVKEGQRCMFQVRVSGEPKPSLEWTFNNQPIVQSSEVTVTEENGGWSRLVIERVKSEDAGVYSVSAKNDAGEAQSSAALVVESPTLVRSSIREEKFETTSTEGFWSDTAILSSPTPPPVPLHRLRTQIDEYAEKQKTYISATSTAPEVIRGFQNEYIATEGEKFTMDCLMVGNPRPKIRIYFNDRLIQSNSKLFEFSNYGDTYSISFNPVRANNAGVYKISAENDRGLTETQTVLRVRPRSHSVSKTPHTVEHTQITEEFGAFEYEQRVPEARVHTVEKQRILEESGCYQMIDERRLPSKQSFRSSNLISPPPAKKQQITHEREEKLSELYDRSSESRRVVGNPPHFTQTLVSTVSPCGESTKFEGIVTGWPAPDIQWSKDGVIITAATHPEFSFSNVGGRVSLAIPTTTADHGGKYMCTARNASGVATSSAQLVVRPKTIAPDFVQRLISEEAVEGQQLKWIVKVIGDPRPKVTWLRDGQVIPHCQEVQLRDEGDGVHSMTIVKVELADCGQFTCLAENIAGEARSTADLVVRGKSDEPGSYFHVTKVTEEKQVKGEEVTKNQAFTIEEPRKVPQI